MTIKSIEIELENYEPIDFTMDEAKELYEQLHSLFGPITVYPWYQRPYYTWYNTHTGTTTCNNIATSNSTEWTTMDMDLKEGINCLAGYQVESKETGMKVTYNEN